MADTAVALAQPAAAPDAVESTLPVMLHTMVEFPLYQSLPHLWLLMLLTHLALRQPEDRSMIEPAMPGLPSRMLRLNMAGGAIALMLFFFSGLQTNTLLT